MNQIQAFNDGAGLLRGGLRVAGWAFVLGVLIHGGGAPGYSQGRPRVSPGNSFRVGIVGTTNTQAGIAAFAPLATPRDVKTAQHPAVRPPALGVDSTPVPGYDPRTWPDTTPPRT